MSVDQPGDLQSLAGDDCGPEGSGQAEALKNKIAKYIQAHGSTQGYFLSKYKNQGDRLLFAQKFMQQFPLQQEIVYACGKALPVVTEDRSGDTKPLAIPLC